MLVDGSTICFKNFIIKNNLKQIIKILKKHKIDCMEIGELLTSTLKEVEYARKSGVAMERRLQKYYNAVVKLGFERKIK